MRDLIRLALTLTLITTFEVASATGAEWVVPVAGNTYRSQPGPGNRLFDANGSLLLKDAADVFSIYFHTDRSGSLKLAIKGRATGGTLQLEARVGNQTLQAELQDAPLNVYTLGDISVTEPGYVRVDLQCGELSDSLSAEVSELSVVSNVEGLTLDYVKNNDGNMFYWGRRGPSVHLGYQLPKATNLTYAYNEVTVPVGQDPIGSYFMSNGFSEGYFGIQVNSASERRILFSVWSPFHTDNPKEIPAEERVVTLAKGKDVHALDFGNEGSGGQSYLIYPWKAGVTYRFLTEVKPDGKGNTLYTSWFAESDADTWRLIASFHRPKTDKHLTGFHSFLESFAPEHGHLQRSARYGNQWVCDVEGKWHPVTQARFTGDNTARGRNRLDYAGGVQDNVFFLKNCGFFEEPVSLDNLFEREANSSKPPAINFENLPRS